MTLPSRHSKTLFAIAIAALALGACSKTDDRTAGQKVDASVTAVEREAAELKADAAAAAAKAKQAASEAVKDVKEAAGKVGDKVSSGVSDASIITSVNAELGRDAKLDPGKIDVDASHGRVALRGTAPDAQAVQRARQIALTVKGVTGVDNYLTIASKS